VQQLALPCCSLACHAASAALLLLLLLLPVLLLLLPYPLHHRTHLQRLDCSALQQPALPCCSLVCRAASAALLLLLLLLLLPVHLLVLL
jgi:hypothetical protein